MYNGMYHTERKYMGKPIIIDLAEIYGKFEVMVMGKKGIEIECFTSKDFDEAKTKYMEYRHKYYESEGPLKGKYAKLRDDIIKALSVGEAAETDDDGGACNFDGCAILTTRWRESLLKQVAREAGTTGHKWKIYGASYFVFSPRTHGQGNKRADNAEAMTKYMQSLGYDALTYCQMD